MASFDDAAVAAVMARAADKLSRTSGAVVLMVSATPAAEVRPEISGWCEVGRLSDAAGRCWWKVLYHPEGGDGRMLRYFPRAKRGPLGEIVGRGAE